jgi:hypothetical protein
VLLSLLVICVWCSNSQQTTAVKEFLASSNCQRPGNANTVCMLDSFVSLIKPKFSVGVITLSGDNTWQRTDSGSDSTNSANGQANQLLLGPVPSIALGTGVSCFECREGYIDSLWKL